MSKHRPLNNIEDILVFSYGKVPYNPQMSEGKPYDIIRDKKPRIKETNNAVMKQTETHNTGERYPVRTLNFKQEKGLHPTQKPTLLFEYLINTYTNENMTVLDNTMGSGTTRRAAKKLNRRFIGIEKDEKYFSIAVEQINA